MKRQTWILALLAGTSLWGTSLQAQQDDDEQGKKINAKFYHITVEIPLDKPHLKGNVLCKFAALQDGISEFDLDISSSLKVSKVEGVPTYNQEGERLRIKLDKPTTKGQEFEFKVFYEGDLTTEKFGNLERGMLYKTHGEKDEHTVIATACYPSHAHLWFPCVQRTIDKVDSVYVDITIPDKKTEVEMMNPNTKQMQKTNIPYIAVSNGVLAKTEKGEGTKTYKWRHRYRIAPQHILIAVSNYAKITSDFKGKGYNYPIDFYVFPEKYDDAQAMSNRSVEIMECLTKTFGDYPFRNERFAVTQAGFPLGDMNGLPTQTNVLMESVKSTNISSLVRHSASMWFGNHISPLTPKDAWITEGLASYAEAMWQEYKRGLLAVDITLKEKKQYFDGGKLSDNSQANYKLDMLDKRGAYVIHMLRGVMTDGYFFEALKGMTSLKKMRGESYGKTYLTTDDFRKICQYYASENEDQDFTYFFKEWIDGEFYPVYEIKQSLGKKGEILVTVKQDKRTTPEFFKMPVEIKIIFADSTDMIQKVVNDQQEQTFTIANTSGKAVAGVVFDPKNWIFKEVRYTHQVLNTKTPITDFQLKTEDHGRTVHLSFNSTKKQDVKIELIEIDLEGNPMKPQVQTVTGATGEVKQSFKIPLDKKSRGTYIVRVVGKSDVYSKELYLNRVVDLF